MPAHLHNSDLMLYDSRQLLKKMLCSRLFWCSCRARLCDRVLLTVRFDMSLYYYYYYIIIILQYCYYYYYYYSTVQSLVRQLLQRPPPRLGLQQIPLCLTLWYIQCIRIVLQNTQPV